jgi:hypothetical protein
MGNLHELHVPTDSDEAADWAARREFGLRYDSYREAQLRENAITPLMFICRDPETEWIHSMRAELLSEKG